MNINFMIGLGIGSAIIGTAIVINELALKYKLKKKEMG